MLKFFYQKIRVLYLYVFADSMIANYPRLKSQKHRVNLFDYHPEFRDYKRYNNSRYNLGDSLGFVIAQWMLEKKGLSLDTWVRKRKHFNCVGSNIFVSFQNSTIWGSGVHYDKKYSFLFRYPFSRFDFRAVRGPLSRKKILDYGHKCPEVYGDPAILMPFIYKPVLDVKCHELLVIPQFIKELEFRSKYPELFIVSMNTNDYKSVIDAIASSKKVVTSSLHAIILADAYGVPSVFFRGLPPRADFKYLDYYYSTGRWDVKIAETFEEALNMEPMKLPDLRSLQNGLLQTFPYDLWEK